MDHGQFERPIGPPFRRVTRPGKRIRRPCCEKTFRITLGVIGNTAMRTVSFKLPPALDARLTAFARRRGMTRSAVVRAAVEALENDESHGSVTKAAIDLVGSLSGPR